MCSPISRATAAQKEQIIGLKQELIARDLYAFDKFHSMDVYQAVLEEGVAAIEEFLEKSPKA